MMRQSQKLLDKVVSSCETVVEKGDLHLLKTSD